MPFDLSGPLAVSRIAAGAAWLAPRAALRASLLDPSSGQSAYLLRLFAVREAGLGALMLLAPAQRAALLRLGLVTDSLDVAAGLLALRSGAVGRSAGAAVTGAALGAVTIGWMSLRARSRS